MTETEVLRNALYRADVDPEDCEPFAYSGRNMTGRECPALRIDQEQFTLAMIELASGDEYIELARDLTRAARWDSLGHGTVVYFPDLVGDLVDELGCGAVR